MTISQEDYETETGQKRTILFTILVNTERFNIHLMVKTENTVQYLSCTKTELQICAFTT